MTTRVEWRHPNNFTNRMVLTDGVWLAATEPYLSWVCWEAHANILEHASGYEKTLERAREEALSWLARHGALDQVWVCEDAQQTLYVSHVEGYSRPVATVVANEDTTIEWTTTCCELHPWECPDSGGRQCPSFEAGRSEAEAWLQSAQPGLLK